MNELDWLYDLDQEKLNEFKQSSQDLLKINKTTKKSYVDFSWIPMIEQNLEYIDNIIRNPRRFIIPEEEILIVEKTKKVNQETVRHLASHTNYIQDIDEDGMVKPSKLLNVNKEETYDIYENRFIITLIKRLNTFLAAFDETIQHDSEDTTQTDYIYQGQTKIDDEVVSINMNLRRFKAIKSLEDDIDYDDIKNRIKNIRIILDGFFSTNFIKSIMQASPVYSPIHKTNLILKDVNFQQALILWEFLDSHELSLDIREDVKNETKENEALKNKFLTAYYFDYYNSLELPTEDEETKKLNLLNKLVQECASSDKISAKELEKDLMKNLKVIEEKENNMIISMKKACNRFLKAYNNKVSKALNLLK